MTRPDYVDRRTALDFLGSGLGVVVFGLVLALAARPVWVPAEAARPAAFRVSFVREGLAREALRPVHFSLPTAIGFSRTVPIGEARPATTLGPRLDAVRFWPRPESPATRTRMWPDREQVPGYRPWLEEPPVYAAAPAGAPAWRMLAEPVDGARVELPDGLEAAAGWPADGMWSALVRLEADPDGRVTRAFVMPPADPALAARLAALMRRARLPAGQPVARVRISRVAAPAPGADEREAAEGETR